MGMVESRDGNESFFSSDGEDEYFHHYDDSSRNTPTKSLPHIVEDRMHCECKNCAAIMAKFSECSICLSALQNTTMYSCMRCGGIWCGRCMHTMAHCPFCRGPLPTRPCAVLRRILRELNLPCRNWRLGCPEFLSSETRLKHEASCPHNQVACDIEAKCSMYFPIDKLSSHMTTYHKVTTLTEVPFNLQIQHFSSKMNSNRLVRNKYKLYLLAYNHTFTIKVSFFNLKLHLGISRKPFKFEVHEKSVIVEKSFCATATFDSNFFKNVDSWIVRDHKAVKKCLIKKEDYEKFAFSEEVANLTINIEPLIKEDETGGT